MKESGTSIKRRRDERNKRMLIGCYGTELEELREIENVARLESIRDGMNLSADN